LATKGDIMTQAMKELQRIKGIGSVFAQRFLDAGYDTFAKIAAAGEEELRSVRGINTQMVRSILAQASELAGEVDKTRIEKVEELKHKAALLMNQVQDIALNVHKHFKKKAAGKRGKKIRKEIARIITALEEAKGKLSTKVKKTGKVLTKAEKHLSEVTETGLKGLGKKLKKARKSLKKNLPK
jgi:uncharacterized coiled-coil DUF342 family protein